MTSGKKLPGRGRPKQEEPTRMINLRLKESLITKLTATAQKAGLPLSTYIRMVLTEKAGKDPSDQAI